jgi:integrase
MFAHFGMEDAITIPSVPKERTLKWWLTPEVEEQATRWMREQGYDDLADYTRWTVLTGLRVMETLRVSRQHFTALASDEASLTVPGTKTRDAQATLPLLPEAATLARNRLGRNHSAPSPADRLFPVRYVKLHTQWMECRRAIGLGGIPGATLKAFRRSFARQATERGLPPDMLRQYMRHEHLETTAGYLRLVGGYSTDTMRQWLR